MSFEKWWKEKNDILCLDKKQKYIFENAWWHGYIHAEREIREEIKLKQGAGDEAN